MSKVNRSHLEALSNAGAFAVMLELVAAPLAWKEIANEKTTV